jgi:hypothetical protein
MLGEVRPLIPFGVKLVRQLVNVANDNHNAQDLRVAA